MTKHLFILGMACACLLFGLAGAGCGTPGEAPPSNVQDHGDVPPAPGSVSALPGANPANAQ